MGAAPAFRFCLAYPQEKPPWIRRDPLKNIASDLISVNISIVHYIFTEMAALRCFLRVRIPVIRLNRRRSSGLVKAAGFWCGKDPPEQTQGKPPPLRGKRWERLAVPFKKYRIRL
jgi:hypothetical protein